MNKTLMKNKTLTLFAVTLLTTLATASCSGGGGKKKEAAPKPRITIKDVERIKTRAINNVARESSSNDKNAQSSSNDKNAQSDLASQYEQHKQEVYEKMKKAGPAFAELNTGGIQAAASLFVAIHIAATAGNGPLLAIAYKIYEYCVIAENDVYGPRDEAERSYALMMFCIAPETASVLGLSNEQIVKAMHALRDGKHISKEKTGRISEARIEEPLGIGDMSLEKQLEVERKINERVEELKRCGLNL